MSKKQLARALRVAGYFAWLAVLTLCWVYEQPSIARTFLVLAVVFALGFAAISAAARNGFILSRRKWLFAFSLKMTLTLLITSLFWVAPLGQEHLRDAFGGGVQDSNIYDYNGKLLAEAGLMGPDPGLQGVWLDYGIVRYIAIIYSLFGVSVLYVAAFNALASLCGILCLAGTLAVLGPEHREQWQSIRFAMLLPFASYYDATPAKEAPTNLLFYLALFLCSLMLIGDRKGFNIKLGFALTCVLLAIFRLNVFFFVGLSTFCALLMSRTNWKKMLLITFGFLVGFVVLVSVALHIVLPGADSSLQGLSDAFLNVSARMAMAQDALSAKEGSASPLVSYVGRIVIPHNVVDFLTLAPLRALIWTYLPFPLVFPAWKDISSLPALISTDYFSYISVTETLCAKLSTITLIVLTPGVFAVFRNRLWKKNPQILFLVFAFLITTLLISNLQVFETRRYRVLVEPMFVALSLWGYAYGNPMRFARWIWPLFFAPAFIVWLVA